MSYWDTSALVKLYVLEPDSQALEAVAIGFSPIATSHLGAFEFRRTIWWKEREGSISAGADLRIFKRFKKDVEAGYISLLPLDAGLEAFFDHVLQRLRRGKGHAIRTADAIHLASALLGAQKELVCTDRQMRRAAEKLGLAILP